MAKPAAENHRSIYSGDAFIKLSLVYGTAIFYFSGWMYLYYFLRFFEVSIFSVDIPFHYFFVYSFAIVRFVEVGLLPQTGSTYVTVIGAVLAFACAMGNKESIRRLSPVFLIISLLSLFFVVTEVARNAADHHVTAIRRERTSAIRLTFDAGKLKTSDGAADLVALSSDNQLIPVFETPKVLLVFHQPTDPREPPETLIMGSLFVVDKSALLFSERTVRSIWGGRQ